MHVTRKKNVFKINGHVSRVWRFYTSESKCMKLIHNPVFLK